MRLKSLSSGDAIPAGGAEKETVILCHGYYPRCWHVYTSEFARTCTSVYMHGCMCACVCKGAPGNVDGLSKHFPPPPTRRAVLQGSGGCPGECKAQALSSRGWAFECS